MSAAHYTYPINCVLWRRVISKDGKHVVDPAVAQQTPKGSWAFKVSLGSGIPEPEIRADVRGSGIMAFANSPPPQDWTYAVVHKVANTVLIVQFPPNQHDPFYVEWRRAYEYRLTDASPLDVEHLASVATAMSPLAPDMRDLVRLVVCRNETRTIPWR